MFPMKEKPMSTKRAEPRRDVATGGDGQRKEAEPRRETGRWIRTIVERHRETLDYPAGR
jgi:hypothetical protein